MNRSEDPPMPALDAALGAALRPPVLPPGFERRVMAAVGAQPQGEWTRAARTKLERERLEHLAELKAGYVRLRRRTLGTLVGGAFAAGAVLTLALPALQAAFGANVSYVLAGGGALLGLALIAASLKGNRVRLRIVRLFG
ncbi:MAG TPA: hypothetical protein VMD03_10600 [Steroidobacteraceae bacterium]|nr:hypothetical protein [Steroidobacteraceae bacterium]